jgi:hypothetical protein
MRPSLFILVFTLSGLVAAQDYEEKLHLPDSLVYEQKSNYDRKLIITNLQQHYNSKALWVAEI